MIQLAAAVAIKAGGHKGDAPPPKEAEPEDGKVHKGPPPKDAPNAPQPKPRDPTHVVKDGDGDKPLRRCLLCRPRLPE